MYSGIPRSMYDLGLSGEELPAVRSLLMRRLHPIIATSEVADFADDVRRVFQELGRAFDVELLTGECSPPIDVFETEKAVEITVDLPGVEAAAVRILMKGGTVLVVGEKTTRRGRAESTFLLVERGFGRFARTVSVVQACDPARARAVLRDGELRLSIPKIAERRGHGIPIPVTLETRHT
jgi:HSP20 family protein